MCNGRLVLCVLAVLSVVAAGFLALALPASAAPCPDKEPPAASGRVCDSGGPPSPAPTAPAPAGPVQGGAGSAETQPIVTDPGVANVPAQETVSGEGTAPAPSASAGTPSAGTVTPPGVATFPSRSARTLTAAPPDSGAAGSGPMAGYLVAIGGGMLLLSSVFGFMRFRPAAR
ncbi:hypothetical protein [Arthrobacter sp. B10-11]|uniref:hypothetical protein n=1 Tax=Arthrobacter sp. B10-11 TaxID=3081160 RepID=UPI002952FAE7|nr:hypothetical protein [Arthrobacter sp. B10-11]MDV8147817.1 hypothetical protein [Arthrobacter sp. B10-11]